MKRFELYDKIWIVINNYSYPGTIIDKNEEIYGVIRYYDGIYTLLYVQANSLHHREIDISYDIFLNRRQYLNE